jgi:hypothetical protein
VNDSLKLLREGITTSADFNVSLGALYVGDTVYVAYGPGPGSIDIRQDAGALDFTIICEHQGIPPPMGTVILVH